MHVYVHARMRAHRARPARGIAWARTGARAHGGMHGTRQDQDEEREERADE